MVKLNPTELLRAVEAQARTEQARRFSQFA
jgi:hypothetical protein